MVRVDPERAMSAAGLLPFTRNDDAKAFFWMAFFGGQTYRQTDRRTKPWNWRRRAVGKTKRDLYDIWYECSSMYAGIGTEFMATLKKGL